MFWLHFLNPKLYNHFKCITATTSMPPYTFLQECIQTLDQLNAENLGKLCAEIEAFW